MYISIEVDPSDFSIIDVVYDGNSVLSDDKTLRKLNQQLVKVLLKDNNNRPRLPKIQDKYLPENFTTDYESYLRLVTKLKIPEDTIRYDFNTSRIEIFCPKHEHWKFVDTITKSDCKTCNENRLVKYIKKELLVNNKK